MSSIIYKTEAKVELAPRLPGPLQTAAALWEKGGGHVTLVSGAQGVKLDQQQLRSLVQLAETIWDDIGPEHHPRSAPKSQ